MVAAISGIEYYLPSQVLANQELALQFPDWPAEKILEKTGIRERRVAARDETSVDMAVSAGRKIFENSRCEPSDVDFLILCTQSPDYFLPTSACLVQSRLGLPTNAGALDINLGCSGFVYGLSLAKGLVECEMAKTVLLVTSETYSKFLEPADKSVRTIFGDGAAATVVKAFEPGEGYETPIGPFVFGTDGTGANSLIVKNGGLRTRYSAAGGEPWLSMDGASIFSFTLRVVPRLVKATLEKANLTMNDIDWFVFHQANQFMLEALRKQIGLPKDRFVIDMEEKGNTVSSTIPIAMAGLLAKGQLRSGQRLLLVGFGVGLSWAGAVVRWP